MATTAPPVESDLHADHSDHPYHLPSHLPNEPKIGDHILFTDHGTTRHALVQVVFPEHGMPEVTLVLVRPGNQGLQTKRLIPHRSKAHDGCYWCRPEEVQP